MDAPILNKLASLERVINYVFNNKLLGILALLSDSRSIRHDGQLLPPEKNDRLAIVGDKAIDMVLCDMWFDARGSRGRLDKGQWSELQRDLVTDDRLAERGFDFGLDAFVIKNPGHYGPLSKRMMATAVEAIIGAVDKDTNGDRDAIRAVMNTLGFFEHPLLMVTYCGFLPRCFRDIQMITNVQFLDPS